MGNTKAASKTTSVEQDAQSLISVFEARKLFLTSTIDMSWKLALSIILPLGLGIKLDKTYDTEPLFIFVGLVIGVIAGGLVVWKSVQNVENTVNKTETEKRNK